MATPLPIHENFARVREGASIEYQLNMPGVVLPRDADRLWGSVQIGQIDAPIGISHRSDAELGDPDVAQFIVPQGAAFFETYGTNELYVIGLPVGSPLSVTVVRKDVPLASRTGRSFRCATRIETVCGGGPVNFAAPFLPADPQRRRAYVRIDSPFGAVALNPSDPGVNFQTVAPFFPGYAVVEGTEALWFRDFGTGPTNAWWIVDREVSAED
jgi:hypothetical protein